ncbi:uncharacterized protein BT62DRAFT_998490 [Guyanagaster necrorhizus]|uniref:Uncharacterized protein n=1 Tax=Guyanagaster necrorhizus TaxID=856835 RepID=A0A9P7W723_9AGAR|nr:uncharacterized protein BT62DRAFT_998490 [Guyanagaster necrorhizus MCA 3950]KAG7452456.1 hypothetical protein BT62DRAFT_998490 [Guyanagaster necrorhizus MCA 3950]
MAQEQRRRLVCAHCPREARLARPGHDKNRPDLPYNAGDDDGVDEGGGGGGGDRRNRVTNQNLRNCRSQFLAANIFSSSSSGAVYIIEIDHVDFFKLTPCKMTVPNLSRFEF